MDKAVYDFRLKLSNNPRWSHEESAVKNEEQLANQLTQLREECIEPLKLEEYFYFDTKKIVQEFKEFLDKNNKSDIEKQQAEPKEADYNIFRSTPSAKIKKHIKETLQNFGAKRMGLTFNFDSLLDIYSDVGLLNHANSGQI